MNSQDIRALQEAYSQVYELDEVSQKTATRAFAARATDEFESDGADYNYTKGGKSKADETKRRIEKKHGKAAGQHAERAAHAKIFGRKKTALTSMPPKPTKTNEEVDLYDIILSHLLDEGYADTEQAAEAIMVNMSDDWRESIVEEVLDEVSSADYTALAKTKKPRSKESIQARYHAKRLSKPEPETGKKSPRPSSPLRSKMTQDTRDAGRLAAEYGSYDEPGYGSSSKGSLPKGKKLERQKKTGVSD